MWQKSEWLKTEDSREVNWSILFPALSYRFSLWSRHVMNERLKNEDLSDKRWGELIID